VLPWNVATPPKQRRLGHRRCRPYVPCIDAHAVSFGERQRQCQQDLEEAIQNSQAVREQTKPITRACKEGVGRQTLVPAQKLSTRRWCQHWVTTLEAAVSDGIEVDLPDSLLLSGVQRILEIERQAKQARADTGRVLSKTLTIQLAPDDKVGMTVNDFNEVVAVDPFLPAAKAGVDAGDLILSVDEVECTEGVTVAKLWMDGACRPVRKLRITRVSRPTPAPPLARWLCRWLCRRMLCTEPLAPVRPPPHQSKVGCPSLQDIEEKAEGEACKPLQFPGAALLLVAVGTGL
jgi:hypothetical protein